ncbi:conserved protein of unknown function [Rhodovastum atsumiense]|nr:conserved protein of unknown function [Rhodovastum atsumiense]
MVSVQGHSVGWSSQALAQSGTTPVAPRRRVDGQRSATAHTAARVSSVAAIGDGRSIVARFAPDLQPLLSSMRSVPKDSQAQAATVADTPAAAAAAASAYASTSASTSDPNDTGDATVSVTRERQQAAQSPETTAPDNANDPGAAEAATATVSSPPRTEEPVEETRDPTVASAQGSAVARSNGAAREDEAEATAEVEPSPKHQDAGGVVNTAAEGAHGIIFDPGTSNDQLATQRMTQELDQALKSYAAVDRGGQVANTGLLA